MAISLKIVDYYDILRIYFSKMPCRRKALSYSGELFIDICLFGKVAHLVQNLLSIISIQEPSRVIFQLRIWVT